MKETSHDVPILSSNLIPSSQFSVDKEFDIILFDGIYSNTGENKEAPANASCSANIQSDFVCMGRLIQYFLWNDLIAIMESSFWNELYTVSNLELGDNSLSGLFWYPRLGWETSLFPHVNNGKSDVSGVPE
ncbi:hypothetical protein AVEN_21462-1 [Araneus ventricosus]|uniref:Uncharacterized protein n=1 Tax=Araneus ventricosus TaxID=182803 RepID=A0A4Y2QLB6_ARAVE|nr:hypothetical protein AVEN_176154-1 [Araneus ventricosus]GBN64078.1 hypothetical protein AVEN_21462-1 [Araneus ventricosus]